LGSGVNIPDDLPDLRNAAGQPPVDVAELALPRPSAGGLVLARSFGQSPAAWLTPGAVPETIRPNLSLVASG